MVDFDDLVHSIAAQFKVVWAAPIPFVVIIGLVTIGIWRAMEWRYGGAIERLKDRLDNAAEQAKPIVIKVPSGTQENERALSTLQKARHEAGLAFVYGGQALAKAYHELDAAMFTIEKRFGVPPLKVPRDLADRLPYKLVLEAYADYVDRFYPLLREGRIEEAQEKAGAFSCSWGTQRDL